jgi:dihydrofolate reductase
LEEAVEEFVNGVDRESFIIGGAQLYRYAMDHGLVDRILASIIPGQYVGDTYFPSLDGWTGRRIERHETFSVWEYKK